VPRVSILLILHSSFYSINAYAERPLQGHQSKIQFLNLKSFENPTASDVVLQVEAHSFASARGLYLPHLQAAQTSTCHFDSATLRIDKGPATMVRAIVVGAG
jgi:hypothetical protein